MKLRDAIRIGLGALGQHRLRAILSTLGVVIGVAAMVAVLSLGDGMDAFARQQIASTTSLQAIGVTPRTTYRRDGVTLPISRMVEFTDRHLDALSRLPHVTRGELRLSGGGLASLPFRTDSARGVVVSAVVAFGDEETSRGLLTGRSIPTEESGDTARIVVVSSSFARWISGGDAEEALGRTVRLGGGEWEVVGITRDLDPDLLTALVPFGAVRFALAPSPIPRPTTIVLLADSLETVEAVRESATQWLAKTDPAWPELVAVTTQEGRLRQARTAARVFKLFMASITGISLLVGGIGIMNILLASVAERTYEIGLRKAVGARKRDIRWQFLAESLAITGTGSAVGIVLGVGLSFGATALMRAQTGAQVYSSLSLSTMVIATFGGVVLGLAFGTYPAHRAANLLPVEALRHE